MKKLLIAFCMLLGFATASIAQATMTAAPPTALSKAKAAKKAKPAASATAAKAPATAATAAGSLKKDGTPDMRYKANKKAKTAGPLKKDGTPDMRYDANKKPQ
jgi:hypothetical protein